MMMTTELQTDYFDCTGPISPQKEITNKESPGPGNRNNRELDSPTREIIEKTHGILTNKNKEMVRQRRNYENSKKIRKSGKTKNGQREEMNRAQIKSKEEEIIAEVTAI